MVDDGRESMKGWLVMLVLVLTVGCGDQVANRPKEDQPAKLDRAKDATRETVQTLTQYDKIKSGQRTMNKVRQISSEHEKDLEEVGVAR